MIYEYLALGILINHIGPQFSDFKIGLIKLLTIQNVKKFNEISIAIRVHFALIMENLIKVFLYKLFSQNFCGN